MLALLSTIFATAAADYATSHTPGPGLGQAAAVHGYTTAFWWAAGIFAFGLLIALLVLPRHESQAATTGAGQDARPPGRGATAAS